MSLYRFLLLTLFIFLSSGAILNAQPETTASGDLLYVKLSNGLNGVLMPLPQAGNAEITFYIKAGSMYENDSLSGISNLLVKIFSEKISGAIKNGKTTLSEQNTTFSSYCNSEHSVFKFTTGAPYINTCLALFRDSVFFSKISQSDISAARNAVLQQLEDAKHDKNKIFEDKLLKGLYVQDHQKLEVLGDAKVLKDANRKTLANFFNKYYVPNNTYLTVTGTFTNVAVEEAMVTCFKNVMKSEFNPETVTKIVDLRPMTYNTQFVVEDTTGVPEFQICWQFPGTNSNFHESYCAFLVNALLNDKNNYIQVKAAKMGCKKFTVEYEANNFNGIFRISFQPSKQNLAATYQFVTTELGRLNKTLLNEAMIGAAKIQFRNDYDALKKTKEYPKWIVNHWAFNDEMYFPNLRDTLMTLTPLQLETFVIAYFNQSPHITGLKISKADREALKVDSVFTDIDQAVGKYVFTYRQNITALEGETNQVKLQNLLQWLTINPDINVQVNGFSDEHEFNRTTDEDSIIQFIDSMPTFQKITSELIKKKRTIRPELARSVKIVKYLYEHGIAAERLNGTAMMFKSSNKQEAADNMKCTLTLNKLRKSPSLYEYHYGKKKE